MFRPTKLIFTGIAICIMTALTGCSLGQAAEPTATLVDVQALETGIVATVRAQQTADAPTITPTFTLTLLATDTLAAAITDTPAIPVEGTSSPVPGATMTITVTPSETPFGTTAIPSFTPVFVANPTTNAPLCKNSAFDGDITIPDKTVMEPWQKFQKVWAVKNTGTCRWDEGFYFAATSGPPSMGKNQGIKNFKTEDRFVEAGATVAISIDMYAPGEPGEYVAHWHMFDDNGDAFGSDFTVVIIVQE